MSFWGVKLKPSKPQVYSDEDIAGRILHVSQATLGLNAKEGERSIVKCKCPDGPAIFICSLKAGVNESCSLDLCFDEDVIFSVSGSAPVHLAGYWEEDENDDYDDDDDDYDDELDEDYRADFINDEEDEEDDSDEEGILTLPARPSSSTVQIEDITGEEKAEPKKAQGDEPEKAIAGANGNDMKDDQGKDAEDETDSEADEDNEDEDGFALPGKRKSSGKEAETASKKKKTVAADDSPATPAETLSAKKKKKKKGKKVAKQDEDDEMKDAGAEEPKQKQTDKSPSKSSGKKAKKAAKKFANGLEIHDMVMGKPDGKQAKPGKKVSIRYIGKLKSNGKIFDSTVGKKPFQFRLGVNEVVKGFDIGVSGMRIGDKRRVVIPPAMGYGTQSVGPIPPNSWLDFEIELVDVKG